MDFPHPQYLVYGAIGALCLELLEAPLYKGRLEKGASVELFGSLVYWKSVLTLVLGSALLAWGLHADDPDAKVRHLFITGLGARTILRQITTALVQRTRTKRGGITLKDVFS